MDHGFSRELAQVPDIRHQMRRLKQFRGVFQRAVTSAGHECGVSFVVDETRLVTGFFNWLEAFAGAKHYAAVNRRDFAHFAAGLMLREFCRVTPVRAVPLSSSLGLTPQTDSALIAVSPIARFWPEGYLATSFCIGVLDAVLTQDSQSSVMLTPAAADLRTWWSFRETVREDPSAAIGFLDSFTGLEPNWDLPAIASARPAMASRRLLMH